VAQHSFPELSSGAGRSLWRGVREHLVSDVCAGCRARPGALCDLCSQYLRARVERITVAGVGESAALTVHATAPYDGPVREALVAFKEHGRWSLREPLGVGLARAVADLLTAAADPTRVCLVPAPSTSAARRQRDGDHVRELARVATSTLRRLGVDARVVPAVHSIRRRQDQRGLNRTERLVNMSGSMAARADVPSLCNTVVVDDILTSGATLAEMLRALSAVGVLPLGACVVAATPDRHGVRAGNR